MDWEKVKNVKSIKLTTEIVSSIQKCIGHFWEGNYYRCSEETQDDVTTLSETLSERKSFTSTDVETALWILERYGYNDTVIKILHEDEPTIETVYEDN